LHFRQFLVTSSKSYFPLSMQSMLCDLRNESELDAGWGSYDKIFTHVFTLEMITNCRFFIKKPYSISISPFLPFYSLLYTHARYSSSHLVSFLLRYEKKLFNLGCSCHIYFPFLSLSFLKWRFLHTINGKYVNIHIIYIARYLLSFSLTYIREWFGVKNNKKKRHTEKSLNARCLNIPFSIPFFRCCFCRSFVIFCMWCVYIMPDDDGGKKSSYS